ncbi:hypothetical protein EDB85DRAFT_2144325 [Lactarius pseudohatsudake]|nr:hypothetical protein EDB85DRAFT_2144325 [Lactarius pseudohatsudake]
MEWEKNSAYFYYSYIPNRVTALSYGLEESLKLQVARIPVGSLTTGDYGYIPGGSTNFANFMRLGNILNDFEDGKAMEVVGETPPARKSVHPPDEMECWPVALPPRGNAVLFAHHETGLASVNAAWHLLITRSVTLTSTHSIMPQDVILVTQSLCIDDHQIDDWKPSPPPVPSIGRATGFGAPAPPMPSIVYPGDVVITRTTTVPAIATSSISDNHSPYTYRRRCPREVVDIADPSTLAQICAIPSIIDITNAAANMVP